MHRTLKVIAIILLACASRAEALNRCEIFWAGESTTTYGEDREHSVLGLAVRNPPLGYAIAPWIDDDEYFLSYVGRTVTNWNSDYGSCDLYNTTEGETSFDCFSYYDTHYVIIQLGINDISGLAQDHEGDVDRAVSSTIAFVQRIQALGKRVIWITIHPMDKDGLKDGKPYTLPELLPEGAGDFGQGKTRCPCAMEAVNCRQYWNSNHEYFIDTFKPWCEENDVGFIDVFQHIRDSYGDDNTDDFVEAYSEDGLHINYPGSEIIYAYIRSQLATLPLFDVDSDGVLDCIDNCPDISNADQTETDRDCIGDACDAFPNDYDPTQPDFDSDGIGNICDNCPTFINPRQNDKDDDRIGDLCDACPSDPYNDRDGDALCGDVDSCPADPYNDRDKDAVCGDVDNCPFIHNPAQNDYDGDGRGDACALCLIEQVYGSYADEVELLRRFRDKVLSKTPEGHELIKLYYQWSPLIVRAREGDDAFKAGTREMIDGIVPLVQEAME